MYAHYCLQNEHNPNLTDGSNTLFEPVLCSGFIMNTEPLRYAAPAVFPRPMKIQD